MIVEIKPIKEVGSCNYCKRGKVNAEKLNSLLEFPYDQVYVIVGNSCAVRMCEDCVSEFIDKIGKLPMPKGM